MQDKPLGKSTKSEVENLVAMLSSGDKRTRSFAWKNAGSVGAAAIAKIAPLTAHANVEVRLAAKRAFREIANWVARPTGAAHSRRFAVREFLAVLKPSFPLEARREALWCLAEIAGSEAVGPVAELLFEKDLREDARMVLEHLPVPEAVEALKEALQKVPEDFRPSVAQGLRRRGIEVPGYPCRKLVPTKKTSVKPGGK